MRTINWLVRIYRRYVVRLPFDHELQTSNYNEIKKNNDLSLLLLPLVEDGPRFSIITPVYKPNIQHFKDMLSSVFNQSYKHWSLILVDDHSECSELEKVLSKAELDYRVTVIRRSHNGHISAASNDGLFVADGNFIVLLDHDDLLQKDALKAVALTIHHNPKVNILYSDEDKINEQGYFEQAHYKPSFNQDLLFSHNYICHLGIYRRTLIEKIGGFRLGVEGCQDYDLILRATKECNAEGIIHIPYVLYHWRIAKGSTALAESEKDYTNSAGLKVLEDYFADDTYISVELGLLSNTFKVNWPIPEEVPLVSIIIPTRNSVELVKKCIDSIYKHTSYSAFEVILVDNQSDEPFAINYFKELAGANKIRLINFDEAFNYSAINNYAVKQAKGDIVILMNNDIEILTDIWLTEMVSQLCRFDIGCVGAKLYFPNSTIQHAGVITGIGGVAGHSHKYFPKGHSGYFKRLKIVQNVSAVTGACLGVRKSIFEQVGGLNEIDLAIAFNDVDFCLKVQKAGYRNIWSPYIEMIHHESISRGAEDTPEKIARFNQEVTYMQNTWGEQLMHDPFYNPWLTLEREDYGLK